VARNGDNLFSLSYYFVNYELNSSLLSSGEEMVGTILTLGSKRRRSLLRRLIGLLWLEHHLGLVGCALVGAKRRLAA
jgi:hypothetical protein